MQKKKRRNEREIKSRNKDAWRQIIAEYKKKCTAALLEIQHFIEFIDRYDNQNIPPVNKIESIIHIAINVQERLPEYIGLLYFMSTFETHTTRHFEYETNFR